MMTGEERADELRALMVSPPRRLSARDCCLIGDVLCGAGTPDEEAEFTRRCMEDELFSAWSDLIMRRMTSLVYLEYLMKENELAMADEPQVALDESFADDLPRREWD